MFLPAVAEAAKSKFSADMFTILGGIDQSQMASATMPVQQLPAMASDDVSGPNRSIIDFQTELPPGSILVRTKERKLYFILPQS